MSGKLQRYKAHILWESDIYQPATNVFCGMAKAGDMCKSEDVDLLEAENKRLRDALKQAEIWIRLSGWKNAHYSGQLMRGDILKLAGQALKKGGE